MTFATLLMFPCPILTSVNTFLILVFVFETRFGLKHRNKNWKLPKIMRYKSTVIISCHSWMASLTIKIIETRLKSTFCTSRDIWRGEKWPIAANNCEKCLSLLHNNLLEKLIQILIIRNHSILPCGQHLRNFQRSSHAILI